MNHFKVDFFEILKRRETVLKCEEKLEKELDIINLIKTQRELKSISKSLLSKRQKMYLKYNSF
jgi:hypothetical protein